MDLFPGDEETGDFVALLFVIPPKQHFFQK